jgi:hypothetical protein
MPQCLKLFKRCFNKAESGTFETASNLQIIEALLKLSGRAPLTTSLLAMP